MIRKMTVDDVKKIIDEEIGECAAVWAGEWQCIGGGQVAQPSTDPNTEDGALERVAKFWSEADAIYACSMQRALRRLARGLYGIVDDGA